MFVMLNLCVFYLPLNITVALASGPGVHTLLIRFQ